MRKWLAGCVVLISATAAAAPELTAQETRWLQGLWPVLVHARETGLPLDVVVQPQPTPDAPPLAMATIAGRCKLVLSMRGNPAVAQQLQRIAPELLDATLELMAAHELGHCHRTHIGAWRAVPAGFVARTPAALPAADHAAWADMQATRREEGYADLVGLAWVQLRHPQHYARLHAWLLAERTLGRVPGGHHDTLAWAQLAARGLGPGSIFEAANALWAVGLADAE